MKVIDKSEFRDENGLISLENRIRGTLRYGLPWFGIMQSQMIISDRLGKGLANDYTLLRNVLIPGTGLIASMILVGPQGVRAITASPLRGVYRAKGEEWLVQTAGGFRKSNPNLQHMAVTTAEVILHYLRDRGYSLPEVEAVLAFSNPRAHVDAAHPNARIVQADGVDHLAANLRQLPPIMDGEDVNLVVDALLRPKAPEPEPAPPAPAPRAARPLAPTGPPSPGPFPEAAPLAGAGPFRLEDRPVVPSRRRRRLRLNRRQWILLGLLLAAEVLIVAVFAVLIAQNTFGG
jgi:hypothetical protein